jgi:hypothetical protein
MWRSLVQALGYQTALAKQPVVLYAGASHRTTCYGNSLHFNATFDTLFCKGIFTSLQAR